MGKNTNHLKKVSMVMVVTYLPKNELSSEMVSIEIVVLKHIQSLATIAVQIH